MLAAFTLSPIYIFPSGLPQPADFVYMLWVALAFICVAYSKDSGFFLRGGRRESLFLGVLVFWVLVVSMANALYHQDVEIAFPALFYIFNFLVFVGFIICANMFGDNFKKYLVWFLCLTGGVLLLFLILGFIPGAARQVAGFNNPNQLGYFSLLLGACGVLLVDRGKSILPLIWMIFVSLLGVLASSSLSSLGAFGLVVLGAALKFPGVFISKKIVTVVFSVLLILFSLTHFGTTDQLSQQWETRLNVVERKLDNVGESRGYTRIIENPEYLFLGAGERGRWRFGSHHSHEMHSSLGTILFSYGFIGLALFLFFLLACFRRAHFYSISIFMAPMAYSLTHQGLRTTFFWVLLALIVIYGRKKS
ncbi:MAG: hypothetical protein Q8L99_04315 [Polycyclovorans sp.]|nr:hypothetical protein [Polycyclovorans sp.]